MPDNEEAIASSPAGFRVVTTPARGFVWPNLRAVWLYRDLLYFMVRRDLALVYKQTALGFAWALLRPLAVAGLYYAVFGLVLDIQSDGVPFAAFVIAGITLWLFFANALSSAASSTVASADLISKVYFPRLTIPLAAVVPPLVDLGLGLIVVEAVLLALGITPQLGMVMVPVVVLIMLMLATGAGLILSALAARFRDVDIVVAFVLQTLLFASAVLYPLSLVPESAQTLYSLNPLVGVMETFRAAILPLPGGIDPLLLLPSAVIGVVTLVGGLFYYARVEQTMADVI